MKGSRTAYRVIFILWPTLTILLAGLAEGKPTEKSPRPNVLLIMTDDQGYGDLCVHGNPRIKTPHLDHFARQSVHVKYFYVSPVCAPTRASLMTGRYNYRTGVTDTYLGRAMMHPDEVTIAELLAKAGYRTGIFGKWHLGDNYPLRAIDQGFAESLVHRGGGIGQPSDPPENSYFDPILLHNGKDEKRKGYCSDIFTNAAIDFIAANRDKPFFVYLPFNCPHTPLQVPDSYYEPYRKMNLTKADFPTKAGHPIQGKFDPDVTAKIYGMITNIDDNLGRLFAKLDELKIADDTIVIFITDNGPQQNRYNAGLLACKGSVHEGGIRVPCYIRWPRQLEAGRVVDQIAAHIDITPTLLEACRVPKPPDLEFDGRSVLRLLRGPVADWPDRTLCFQWHRGDVPVLYRAFAARSQNYKLVQPAGAGNGKMPANPSFRLYDMATDPLETKDIAADKPDVLAKMKKAYQAWFRDVSSTRGYDPPRIHLGTPHENPVILTPQDWRGPQAGWQPKSLGYWEIHVAAAGTYDISLRFRPANKPRTAHFKLGPVERQQPIDAGAQRCDIASVDLEQGDGRLEAWLATSNETVGVAYVGVMRRN